MTVEMVTDGLLKIFFGLVIILVSRLTHRSLRRAPDPD